MPKSHFPARGGTYPQAWSSERRPAAPEPTKDRRAAPQPPPQENRSCRELEAEVQRLRQELARARNGRSSGPNVRIPATRNMLWVALAICGGGLLFALLALLNHG